MRNCGTLLVLSLLLFNACGYEISPKIPEVFPSANATPLPLNVGYILPYHIPAKYSGNAYISEFVQSSDLPFTQALQSSGLFQNIREVNPLDGISNFDILIKFYQTHFAMKTGVPSVFSFFPFCDPLLVGCFIYTDYPQAVSLSMQAVIFKPNGQKLKFYSANSDIMVSAQPSGFDWRDPARISADSNVAAKLVSDMIRDRNFFKSLIPFARVHPETAATPSPLAGEGRGEGNNNSLPPHPNLLPDREKELSSAVNTPDYHGEKRPDDFAVVVGVEKYAQNLPKAEFADEDARAFRAHLIALGVPARHIVYLSDERASRSELVKNIERWLPKNVKPDSRVYFYFSGHGAPDPATGNAYLVGFDGDPSDLSDTAYPLSRLYANLGKLKARHVVVALDSCFSGAGGRSVIAEGTRPLVNRVKEGVIPRNGKLIVLTASKSDQSSGILKDKRHGTFTYYLLKGLNGKALDSKNHVTMDSLYSYLAPKVEDAAHLDDRDQDPQMAPKTRSAGGLTLR